MKHNLKKEEIIAIICKNSDFDSLYNSYLQNIFSVGKKALPANFFYKLLSEYHIEKTEVRDEALKIYKKSNNKSNKDDEYFETEDDEYNDYAKTNIEPIIYNTNKPKTGIVFSALKNILIEKEVLKKQDSERNGCKSCHGLRKILKENYTQYVWEFIKENFMNNYGASIGQEKFNSYHSDIEESLAKITSIKRDFTNFIFSIGQKEFNSYKKELSDDDLKTIVKTVVSSLTKDEIISLENSIDNEDISKTFRKLENKLIEYGFRRHIVKLILDKGIKMSELWENEENKINGIKFIFLMQLRGSGLKKYLNNLSDKYVNKLWEEIKIEFDGYEQDVYSEKFYIAIDNAINKLLDTHKPETIKIINNNLNFLEKNRKELHFFINYIDNISCRKNLSVLEEYLNKIGKNFKQCELYESLSKIHELKEDDIDISNIEKNVVDLTYIDFLSEFSDFIEKYNPYSKEWKLLLKFSSAYKKIYNKNGKTGKTINKLFDHVGYTPDL